MAYQSVWYFTDLPDKVVDLIEEDIAEKFDANMGDSKLHGDALNKEKRNSQNAWIPTTHWVGGFLWHYIQRANRENFLYDLRCIDGESMQYTRYAKGQFYGWHNDAGLATQYKPVSNGNRSDGLHQDFVNENIDDENSEWIMVEGVPRNLPISVLTYDPNNTNIFYAGTGEIYTGGDAIGNGLWKSSDGGVTWESIFGGRSNSEQVFTSHVFEVDITSKDNTNPINFLQA